jgi:hypothetical protein
MIDSIMTPPAPPLPSIVSRMPRLDHALSPAVRADISPAGAGTCLAPVASLGAAAAVLILEAINQNGFQVAVGVNLR